MKTKSIFKVVLVPILLLILLFAVEYISALLSEHDKSHVVLGFVLLGILGGVSLYIVKKIYLNDSE